MYGNFACMMFMYHKGTVPVEARIGLPIPWSWNYRWSLSITLYYESNLAPLEDQRLLLAPEPQPPPFSIHTACLPTLHGGAL